jgi:hypothetical protein
MRMHCPEGTFVLLVWEYTYVADSYMCNIPWDLALLYDNIIIIFISFPFIIYGCSTIDLEVVIKYNIAFVTTLIN